MTSYPDRGIASEPANFHPLTLDEAMGRLLHADPDSLPVEKLSPERPARSRSDRKS